MSESRRLNKAGIHYALATFAVFSGLFEFRSARALEWEPMEAGQQAISVPELVEPTIEPRTPLTWTSVESPAATPQEQQRLNWTAVTDQEQVEGDPIKRVVVWESIEPGEVITADEVELDEADDEVLVAVEPSGTTFANDKAIWRDDQWHPQISGTVPVGFGPKGWMMSASLWGIDCVTGAGYCANPESWDEYRQQIETTGDGNFNLSIGLGDAEELLGLTITSRFEETGLTFGERNTNETNNIFSNYFIGAHVSRNLGSDTALKIGIDNWLDVRECDFCGFPKNAYAVVSQRFRLNKYQKAFLPNAYLTLGMGNGQFRPLDELIRASVAEQRKAGCITAGFKPDKPCSQEALQRATWKANSYGKFEPIGALAIETFSGLNLIGEWSGRNLNAGFSLRPFEEFGLVITSMWENILPNCDWGCTVKGIPDYPQGIDLDLLPSALTERPRFSLQISFEAKF